MHPARPPFSLPSDFPPKAQRSLATSGTYNCLRFALSAPKNETEDRLECLVMDNNVRGGVRTILSFRVSFSQERESDSRGMKCKN